MAKPTKTNKKQKGGKTAPAAKKSAGKPGVAGRGKQKAGAKGKPAKQEKKGGLKARAQKAQAVKQSKSTPREKGGAGKFLREVKVELSKVTWPNREELTQSTIVVFVAIAIAATYIAFFDQIFTRLIELIS